MKKRRSEATAGVEDAERTLHTSFCTAANAVSQLYTQAQNQHKIAFQAGQRHSLEKLSEWIQKQHQQFGLTPSTQDVLNYLKNELDNMSQTEITITQAQNLPLPPQLAPPILFGRPGSVADQQRFPAVFHNGYLPS